jgi:hypothetical protein
MVQPAAARNVLTTLDERPPTSFYWQLTLLATLGGFPCVAAIVFVWRFLPETKNLPVEEIVRVFERQSALGGPGVTTVRH